MKYLKSFEDIHQNKYSDNLFDVGLNKPVGYLPCSTIKKFGGEKEDIKEWEKYADENNLEYRLFYHGGTSSGAVYLYHKESLQKMLDKYKNKIGHFLPTDADKYVKFIEYNIVYKDKDAISHIFIGLTFKDERFTEDMMNMTNDEILKNVNFKPINNSNIL